MCIAAPLMGTVRALQALAVGDGLPELLGEPDLGDSAEINIKLARHSMAAALLMLHPSG